MNKQIRIPLEVTAVESVLPFIGTYYAYNKTMPTLREIALQFKRTPEWARLCLEVLIKKKLIKRKKGTHRSMIIIKK